MTIARFRVSERGQMALPAGARRRWDLVGGGAVEVADLGDVLLVLPADRGLRTLLGEAIRESGGYPRLAADAVADEPDLA